MERPQHESQKTAVARQRKVPVLLASYVLDSVAAGGLLPHTDYLVAEPAAAGTRKGFGRSTTTSSGSRHDEAANMAVQQFTLPPLDPDAWPVRLIRRMMMIAPKY